MKVEIKISKLSEYLSYIGQLPDPINIGQIHKCYYYRGENAVYDNQKASLFRKSVPEKHYPLYEIDLIDTVLQRYPSYFTKCNTLLEKLTMMQHYCMPTRLLDVTKNPLVALYFACQPNDSNSAGRVYFSLTKIIPIEHAELLAECIMYYNNSLDIDGYYSYLKSINFFKDIALYDNHKNKYKKFLKKNIDKSCLFIPSYTNERIKKQEGAFVFSPLARTSVKQAEFKQYYNRYPSDLSSFFYPIFFTINDCDKKSILDDLDLCGISEETLFPDIEHQFKGITRRCDEKVKNTWEVNTTEEGVIQTESTNDVK